MNDEDRLADKQYECIKEFKVKLYEENGIPLGEYTTIPVNSFWIEDLDTDYIGGEIHLDCFETFDWIEISREKLDKYFKEVL